MACHLKMIQICKFNSSAFGNIKNKQGVFCYFPGLRILLFFCSPLVFFFDYIPLLFNYLFARCFSFLFFYLFILFLIRPRYFADKIMIILVKPVIMIRMDGASVSTVSSKSS